MSNRKPKAKHAATGSRTLNELEPLAPGDSVRRPPSRAVSSARAVPLGQLSPTALLTLLHDGRGLRHVLPFAAQAAALDPWAERDFHRGDLLLAVLQTRSTLHPPGTKLHAALVALARKALAGAEQLSAGNRVSDVEAEVSRWLAQNAGA